MVTLSPHNAQAFLKEAYVVSKKYNIMPYKQQPNKSIFVSDKNKENVGTKKGMKNFIMGSAVALATAFGANVSHVLPKEIPSISNMMERVLASKEANTAPYLKTLMSDVSPALQQEHLKLNEILMHQDKTKPTGAYVNLFNENTPLYSGMEAMGPQKGYNLFGAHGAYNVGVRQGASSEEARKLGIPEGVLLSPQGIADLIKNSDGYDPSLPIKMLNCELGKAHIAQEVADILGNTVIAGTENIWLNNNRGALTVAKATADGNIDFTKPGKIEIFKPRTKDQRGSVINMYPDTFNDVASRKLNGERASHLENKLMGDIKTFANKDANDIYNILKADKYYSNKLPTNIMVPGLSPTVAQDLANISNQPVRAYGKGDAFYTVHGFQGVGSKKPNGGLDNRTRDLGTMYYPKNYKPMTDKVPTSIDQKAPWLSFAATQLGVKESGMSNVISNGVREASNKSPEIGKYLQSVNLDSGFAWCASFTNWAMNKAGVANLGSRGSMARNWKGFGQELSKPAYGSVAVSNGHTGFVVGIDHNDPTQVLLLGGNQGDSVNILRKPISDFTYRHPDGFKPDYNVPKYDLKRMGYAEDAKTYPYLDERARVR